MCPPSRSGSDTWKSDDHMLLDSRPRGPHVYSLVYSVVISDVEDIEPQLDKTFELEELQSDDMRKRQSGHRNKTKLRKSVRIKGQDKLPSLAGINICVIIIV